ncbi:TetR/AcrR family transcriptional regulator [Protaetiibacter intestinalis]|uniref:TetR/AcrR family transcriptional regulator n=1 Tax=Protaetiibacter intestinalis TaxID=2419774 RepID=A0A387B710_9MICO|nr:TetR/AcrR family transcriptional regulator [Protaetiibacter intestinalis]AYF99554.1 TetR/AcrR family transcriptional regulator [Protaetiibacter intestinalis]
MNTTETTDPRTRVVQTADELFYARGVSTVTMDQLRDASGVSLKRLYSMFPSKEDVVVGVLERRRSIWTEGVESLIDAAPDARSKVLAVYDFLAAWFCDADFRGCVFVNTFAELGATSPRVAAVVREQKAAFQQRMAQLVTQLGGSELLAAQLAILAEGAQTTAAISGAPDAAAVARAAAETLISAEL